MVLKSTFASKMWSFMRAKLSVFLIWNADTFGTNRCILLHFELWILKNGYELFDFNSWLIEFRTEWKKPEDKKNKRGKNQQLKWMNRLEWALVFCLSAVYRPFACDLHRFHPSKVHPSMGGMEWMAPRHWFIPIYI